MNQNFIPYGKPVIDDEDIAAVTNILKTDWLTQGPVVQQFEEAVANKVGSSYAVAVSNGTAALHTACFACGITEGDEVITVPNTFVASANCALYLGASVKFVDISPETYCMDPVALEASITPKTKAIIAVDYAGQPCDLEEIQAIAKKHNIVLIEDACHSLGAKYKDQLVGSIADITTFSFHAVKNMTSGEGGMLVTNNPEYARRAAAFRTHGISYEDSEMQLIDQAADNEGSAGESQGRSGWYYEMQDLGFNYRITDLQCALGLSQLRKLDQFIERRAAIAQKYNDAFNSHPNIDIPKIKNDRTSAWHLYMLRIRLDQINKTRRQIFDELRAQGIGVHVHYIPIHLQPYYRREFNYKRGDFPNAESFYDSALTLPVQPALDDEQAAFIIEKCNSVIC